jgi:hypothetical protein
MAQGQRKHVLIPNGYWTPFRDELFTNWLADFRENDSVAIYALLYDRACHNSDGSVRATLDDLAEWSGLDLHDVEACTKELRNKRLIKCHRKRADGKRRPPQKWTVPLAGPELNKTGWTPVPRFIFQKYIPAYRDSVLLLLLLRYQNWYRQNYVYPGLRKLTDGFGWTKSRTVNAIMTMSDSKRWKNLKTGLLRPLTAQLQPVGKVSLMHFHVRAVVYEDSAEEFPIVRVAKTFARKFNIPPLK